MCVLLNTLPSGYEHTGVRRSTKRGRRNGHITQDILRKAPPKRFITFGHFDVTSTKPSKPVRVTVIYCPPPSSLTSFLEELSAYLSEVVVTHGDILITGDFNIQVELNIAPGMENPGRVGSPAQCHVTYSQNGPYLGFSDLSRFRSNCI